MPQQLQHVQPGDLVTSDLLNKVIDELVSLRQAVNALQVTTTNVFISGVSGPTPLRPGAIITINGQGFVVPASLNAIAIGGVGVPDVSGVSTQLVTKIPEGLVVSAGGQLFDLLLNNARGSAKTQLSIMPRVVVPFGHTDIRYAVAPVIPGGQPGEQGPIAASSQYVFGFRLTAFADQPGSYAVAATSSDPAWTAVLLGDSGTTPRTSNLFQIGPEPNDGVGTDVRLLVNSAPAGSASVHIDVIETSPGTQVTPANTVVTLTVGQPPPVPQDKIRIVLQDAEAPAVIEGTHVKYAAPRGVPGGILFRIFFKESGDYELKAALSQPGGWAEPSLSSSTIKVPPTIGAIAPMQVNVVLVPGTGASPTDLLLTLRRVTDNLTVKYALGLTLG
jgi:hypothetical protein